MNYLDNFGLKATASRPFTSSNSVTQIYKIQPSQLK